MPRSQGFARSCLGLVVVLLTAGCSLPNTGAEPTAAVAAAATPPPAPAVLDVQGAIQTASAAFAQVPGGTSYYDCSFGGTLFDCPLTDRLRARLIAAQIRLCSCPEGRPIARSRRPSTTLAAALPRCASMAAV